MSFFRTIFALCTRVNVLPDLLQTPVWRAILHTLLLILLCPLLAATMQTCRESDSCKKNIQQLEKECGGFGTGSEGMCLGGSFEERHYIFELFGENTRLDYVTERKRILELKPDLWKESQGLLLTKEKGIFWIKTPDASFLFWDIPADVMTVYLSDGPIPGEISSKLLNIATTSSSVPMTSEKLLEAAVDTLPAEKEKKEAETAPEQTAEKAPAAQVTPPGQTAPEQAAPPTTDKKAPDFTRLNSQTIIARLLSMFWAWTFLTLFSEGLFMMFLGGLCFALMEFLYLRMMPNKLPYSKVYMLTLYSMFPAMIVASLSVLLGQTFISFQTVFLITFFIYQLFSFKKLGLFLNPPDKRKQNDFPDDDF